MFARMLCLILATLSWMPAGAAAGAADPYAELLDGPATATALAEANGEMARAACRRTECLALDDLVTAFDILLRRDVPNTMVRKSRASPSDKDTDIAIRRTVLSHPDRFADYCAALTKLAAHYADYTVGFHAIEIATRLDAASSSKPCTPRVIAAFPRTEDAATMIQEARDTCAADRRAGCKAIRQP